MKKNFLINLIIFILLFNCNKNIYQKDNDIKNKKENIKNEFSNSSNNSLNTDLKTELKTEDYAIYEERTNSGDINTGYLSSNKFVKRNLNTVSSQSGNNISLDKKKGIITLSQGKYWISASAPAYSVTSHQLRLRNIIENKTVLLGTSESTSISGIQTRSFIEGIIDIEKETEFELQHYLNNSKTKCGYGIYANSGEMEVFTRIFIKKMR